MKQILFTLFISLTINIAAQNLIARHSGGIVTFYNSLNSAYSDCISDDTLYLPGGGFETPTQFNKQVHIIGTGAKIDSSVATGNTKLYTTGTEIKINTGSAFSSFEGIYFDDNVTIGSSEVLDNDLNDIVFKFCDFGYFEFKMGAENPSPVNSVTLINCWVYKLIAQNAENCTYYNSIFLSSESYAKNSIFKNCILEGTAYYNDNTIFENCILEPPPFTSASGAYDTYCTFLNNIYTYCCSGATNNHINVLSFYPIFSIDAEDYYQLADDCAGINAGTDGKDIGIYGGTFAWKPGMIPSIPHIYYKNIPDASEGDGTLPVNIKVNAQDN